MQIKQAQLQGVYVNINQLPSDNQAEIALAGRSNVGKSSLINCLANRRNLAKSSSTPGKTRTINYYLINNAWYLVDLPGYGYAKASHTERNKWGGMVKNYLEQRQQLKGVIHLLDIRHPPSNLDVLLTEWLQHQQIPILVVATKADKISRGTRLKHLKTIQTGLNMPQNLLPLPFSAASGDGANELKALLDDILQMTNDK